LSDIFVNGTSACGYIIHDHNGGFIKDFFGKLSLCRNMDISVESNHCDKKSWY